MCSAPKPKDPKAPVERMAAVLPDGGDPMVRLGLRNTRKLARSSMIFTNQMGAVGMPATATLGGGASG